MTSFGAAGALGAVFRPQLPPERLRSVVSAADEAGLEQLWLWEDCFLESGIATAATALAWSERLRVGVGLLPVPLRNVALTTMETATLRRLFPGRFAVGLGHGVQDWMGQVGARVDSPVTLLREHLEAMRALLRGERVTVEGRYVKLDGVALDWPPPARPAETADPGAVAASDTAVFAGARGPRSLRLSGAAADGTVLDANTSLAGIRRARQLIDEGRAAAGRTDRHQVLHYLNTATGPDATDRLRAELVREGHDPADGPGVAGDAATVAEAVAQALEAGADTVVLQPTADEPDPEAFVRFAAEEVRPLLR
ncbi:LLM class flavin-dependent oxidoreductase [Streptomyces oryzae]|uniref:LLM class flavin-dependent oxidoreductase n=1 Tax=Streptomyces oryzae TaxID=1434886 RepID=A0ABS3XM36_9ACTN|nr:LLM class flavin-dependent oxidoreductase [Streptomyces oryzae]MBO8196101.1 LLM class flavin-dependent oxidoreductase [Streptomyces oryzae]